MLKHIFLILCGEDEHKRPRSLKLLRHIKELKLDESQYKIIVSGLSSFNLHPHMPEYLSLSRFLINHEINPNNIIVEKESLDTLGNMVFSHDIIVKLLKTNFQNKPITISLITENFHMSRSKELFLKIFKDIKHEFRVDFNYISANTFGLSSYYFHRKLNVLCQKFLRKNRLKEDIKDLYEKSASHFKRNLLDFFLMDVILTDIDFYRLHTIYEFKDYLFSLPVYNTKYNPIHRKNINFSLYAKLINLHIKK
ncbi:YdcF family protein [Candidatus Woesearchaeota archaeon]|jgi:hypothetical protein|nr:YdcF family protein [Candidatus Woesearchaeota archaeon]MBT4387888.1 YdcF family protein [Candidatus Woesearchaeota archaeon]MBT4595707.1 YdcF family protein [Candidatus Woesearchaeota archaeon]MBT5741444.1 YdcF family protein [Candidatus Woesearchaeota archaeon]MBT6505885.1 YdcF family protein [Candidatus Woesearchaeota archaeon]